MRSISVALVLAAFLTAPAAPAQSLSKLQKVYFSSTRPGSWARYEQTTTDKNGKTSVSEMTLSRLENEGGKDWFEMYLVPKSGAKGSPTILRYLLRPDFPVEKNALDYTKYIDRVIVQAEGKKAQEMPWQTVRTMFGGSMGTVDYGGSMSSKGRETVGGRSCDRYTFSGPFELRVAFISMKGTTEGDICLDEAVPFGRVKESSVTKDDSGKLVSKSEMRLLETGTGAKTRITGPIEKAPDMPDFSKAFGKS